MLSSILKLSVLAALVSAQQYCGPTTTPGPTTTTTTTPPPAGTGTPIHPKGQSGLCVDVAGANFNNGTPVQVYACNNSGAQKWLLKRGNGQIQVAGTNFCLDAGENPANGSKLKIWQCYPGVPQQQWYYTDDNRIAVTDRGLCMDLTDGKTTNGNQLQVWSCGTGNTNQLMTSNVKVGARRRQYRA